MFEQKTFLTFYAIIIAIETCVPDIQYEIMGQTCICNDMGMWNSPECKNLIEDCSPGQIIRQGCKQCICQENKQLSCDKDTCNATAERSMPSLTWCTPFRTYYVNCNVCICPASGRISQSHCVKDASCSLLNEPSLADLNPKKSCIPKVTYLFHCHHCICSDKGFFEYDLCTTTCKVQVKLSNSRCEPNAFFRKGCNICRCPSSGKIEADNKDMCTKLICDQGTDLESLRSLKASPRKCTSYKFIKPICIFCECSDRGTVDENACLESECSGDLKLNVARQSCAPGEMVPTCTECLCMNDGITNPKYCSEYCLPESKLLVLDLLLKNIDAKAAAIRNIIPTSNKSSCEADTVYFDKQNNLFCICLPKYETLNICSALIVESVDEEKSSKKIDFKAKCDPLTFVEFGCNSCFCPKAGNIDPKWCTYDDCRAKREIQKLHATRLASDFQSNEECEPGSISRFGCNFCICPATGLSKDHVCTKNDCTTLTHTPTEKFLCDPLTYYEVDCNICYCPRDGVKNVAKCTKNHCERSLLRSHTCSPGELFSEECNVCVCPPNGNKLERACTNHTCDDIDITVPVKISQQSESLLGTQVPEDETRSLELCFPGEEFIVGCKLCVCPDMGLRVYATCTPIACEDLKRDYNRSAPGSNAGRFYKLLRRANGSLTEETCFEYDVTYVAKDQCVDGAVYALNGAQCACLNTTNAPFCRLVPEMFCSSITDANSAREILTSASSETVDHRHTKYICDRPGPVMDSCHLCQCTKDRTVVWEHCFVSNEESCINEPASFLGNKIMDIV